MMMNFAVPFVLINLICSSAGSGSPIRAGSPINETTAPPTMTTTLSAHRPRQLAETDSGGAAVSAGNSPGPAMMAESDMDYVHEDPTDRDYGFRTKWTVSNQQREQPLTDFQEHFFQSQRYKEKDVPVPFAFSNFKRQQQQHQQQQQHAGVRGRPSSWAGQSAAPSSATDSEFTREITIKQGRVKGIVRAMYRDLGLRDVDQFLGLPYAESPVGNKRFMPPGKTFVC